MLTVYNRKDFVKALLKEESEEQHHSYLGGLWSYEDYVNVQSKWFVCIPKPVFRPNLFSNPNPSYHREKRAYWKWCDSHLKGKILCYSSSETAEWWGFTERGDIFIWTLKWL